MRRRQGWIALVSLLVGLAFGLGAALPHRGSPEPALTAASGPFRLGDLHGDVVLVYFGFASCPDVCPTALATVAAALGGLDPTELARVRPVFVSLDPERDTPERLAAYTELYHPAIVGASAPVEDLRALTEQFAVRWERVPVASALRYVIDHQSVITVLAPDGVAVARFAHGAAPAELTAAIRRVLPPP